MHLKSQKLRYQGSVVGPPILGVPFSFATSLLRFFSRKTIVVCTSFFSQSKSVEQLRARLASAQRVAVIGNGGIALEIVHAVRNCEVTFLSPVFFHIELLSVMRHALLEAHPGLVRNHRPPL
jgi:hypothetical protein